MQQKLYTIITYIKNKLHTFYTSNLFNKLFNKYNFSKVVIIFIVGLSSRIIVSYMYNVNVYLDYFNCVSLTYYIIFSLFIVISHELVHYFEFTLIPTSFSIIQSFINLKTNIFDYIIKMLGTLNQTLLSSKVGNRHTLSSIIKNISKFIKSYYSNRHSYNFYSNVTKNIVNNGDSTQDSTSNNSSTINCYNDNNNNTSRRANNTYTSRSNNVSTSNNLNTSRYRTENNRLPVPNENISSRSPLRRSIRRVEASEDLYFRVNTIRREDSLKSRALYTPSLNRTSYASQDTSRYTPKIVQERPVLSTLTTPTMSTVSEREMFGSHPEYKTPDKYTSRPSEYRNTYIQNFSYNNGLHTMYEQHTSSNISRLGSKNVSPLVTNSSYNVSPLVTNDSNNITPLVTYGSYNVNVTYPKYSPVSASSYGSGHNQINTPTHSYRYPDGNIEYSPNYGYPYPVPGNAPYFNPTRSSINSNHATIGLNGSNEAMFWLHERPDKNSVN